MPMNSTLKISSSSRRSAMISTSTSVKKTYKKYRAAGVSGARLILYKGARHEILNDNCKKAATADILSFVEGNIVAE